MTGYIFKCVTILMTLTNPLKSNFSRFDDPLRKTINIFVQISEEDDNDDLSYLLLAMKEWEQVSVICTIFLSSIRLQTTKRPRIHSVIWDYEVLLNRIDAIKEIFGLAMYRYLRINHLLSTTFASY